MAPRNYSKPVSTAKAKVAGLSRSRTPDDPEFLAARRELAAAKLEAYVRSVVDAAPPLSPEQADRIATLLRSTAAGTA